MVMSIDLLTGSLFNISFYSSSNEYWYISSSTVDKNLFSSSNYTSDLYDVHFIHKNILYLNLFVTISTINFFTWVMNY